jgi:plasmid stability protein
MIFWWDEGRFSMSETVATNIRLPEEMLKALKYRAIEERKSMNQLVREAVETFLTAGPGPESPEKDPMEEIIGIGRSGIKDGSSKHDRYLYGKKR